MGVVWTFFGYESPAGNRDVQRWIDEIPEAAHDELEDTLDYLGVSPRDLWRRPGFDLLDDGIAEIRFKTSRKQYRVFGCFGPERLQFTMLIGATKTSGKGKDKYKPMNARKTALRRKNEVESRSGRTPHEIEI